MAAAEQAATHAESAAAFEGGEGSPLVLLLGLTGSWPIWKPVLPYLTPHHRVLALTLPGHHGGPVLPEGVEPSVEVIADVLIADLKARGITSAHVAGNSLGGWLALELARRGFALSVTALSPAGGWKTDQDYEDVARPFRLAFAMLPVLLFFVTLFLGLAWLRRALLKQTMEHGDRLSAAEVRSAFNDFRRTRMLPALLRNMGKVGGIQPFKAGKTPICIAWCEHDRVIPFARYGRPMLESIEGAERASVPGAGHVPMVDSPAEVAAHILEVTARAEAIPC